MHSGRDRWIEIVCRVPWFPRHGASSHGPNSLCPRYPTTATMPIEASSYRRQKKVGKGERAEQLVIPRRISTALLLVRPSLSNMNKHLQRQRSYNTRPPDDNDKCTSCAPAFREFSFCLFLLLMEFKTDATRVIPFLARRQQSVLRSV